MKFQAMMLNGAVKMVPTSAAVAVRASDKGVPEQQAGCLARRARAGVCACARSHRHGRRE